MAKASSSAVQARYIPEVTWGTTPASALQNFRATSASIKQVNNTVVSDELRADGQVADMVRVGVSATASLGFELSYGSIDDFLAGALRVSGWTADTGFSGASVGTDLLENGSTPRSFTLESWFSDISRSLSITGARVNQIQIQVQNQQKITGSVDFMGKVAALGSASVGTGAATAATTADIMSAVNVSSVTEGGSAVSLLSWDMTIAENARNQPTLGTALDSVAGIGLGRFVVTGNLRAYFEDSVLLAKYLDFTASSLELALADAAGNAYAFQLPRVRYTDATTDVSGNDQDVELAMTYQAVYDATTGKTLRITRTGA